MFTGLIEAIGRVTELSTTGSSRRLQIETPLASQISVGESVAVNGVCLTAIVAGNDEMHADVGPETARITTLGSLRAGRAVNLERSMRADGRVGGHFVQGHVDGVGVVDEVRDDGDSHWLKVSFDNRLSPYLIRKGSIAVDGVSLTIAGLAENAFDVMIIPFTWSHTTLSALRPGDRVNLECDMIGKYVVRAIESLDQSQVNR